MDYCLFEATYVTGCFGFRDLLRPLQGEATPFSRLLVMLQLVHLVTLVFALECFEQLLFLLFKVLLVECMIFMTGYVGFCQMYSGML